jgi:hypothetical protein
MSHAKKFSGGLLVLLIAMFCASEVLAQFPGSSRGGSRGRGESGRGAFQTPRPSNSGDTAELIEYRLGMLEEDLKLSPAQLRLWEPYAERVRAVAADIVRARPPAQSIAAPNAMQQMDRAVDAARNRLTALEEVAAAAKSFYEILNPEQKMLVDARAQSIVSLIAGGAPQSTPDSAGGSRRPARDDGGGFNPPSPRLP